MVTTLRYYIDNADAAVSPAHSAVWSGTPAVRRNLPTTPPSLSDTFNVSESSATPVSVAFVQGVAEDGLAEDRVVTGTMKAAFWISTTGGASPGSPTGGTAQARLRIVLKVVSADGATERGVLGQFDSSVLVFNASNICVRTVSGSLMPVAALAGDRVVAEVGLFYNNTSTSALSSSITPVNVGATTDQPFVDGDTTGAGPRSWVELELNDTDDTDLEIRRMFFPSSGSGASTPPVLPPYSTGFWDEVASGARAKLAEVVTDTARAGRTITEVQAGPVHFASPHQFVSDALPAGKIIRALNLVLKCYTGSSTYRTYLAMRAWVCSNDGSTEQAVLFAGHGGLANTAAFTITARQVQVEAAEYVTQVGDRLVVELGLWTDNTVTSSAAGNLYLGDAVADPDIVVGETGNSGRGWMDVALVSTASASITAFLGTSEVSKLYLGSSEVSGAALGGVVL